MSTWRREREHRCVGVNAPRVSDEPQSAAVVETLAEYLHAVYQQEARRQADRGEDEVRHPDDYDALPEHTKEYDRVLARFILEREAKAIAAHEELREAAREFVEFCDSGPQRHFTGAVSGYLYDRLRRALGVSEENR